MPKTLKDHLDFSALPDEIQDTLKDEIQRICQDERIPESLRKITDEVFKELGWPEPKITQVDIFQYGPGPAGSDLSYFDDEKVLGQFPFPAFIFSLLKASQLPKKLRVYCLCGVAISITVRKKHYRKHGPSITTFSDNFRLLMEEGYEATVEKLPPLTGDLEASLDRLKDALAFEKKTGILKRINSFKVLLNYFLERRRPKAFTRQKTRSVTVHKEVMEDGRKVRLSTEVPDRQISWSGVNGVEYGDDQPETLIYADISEFSGEENLSGAPPLVVRKDEGMTHGILRKRYFSGADPRRRSKDLVVNCLQKCLRELEESLNVRPRQKPDVAYWTKWEKIFDIVLTIVTGRPLGWARSLPENRDLRTNPIEDLSYAGNEYLLIYDPQIKTKAVTQSKIARKKIGNRSNSENQASTKYRDIRLEDILCCTKTSPLRLALPPRMTKLVLKYTTEIKSWLKFEGRDENMTLGSALKGLLPSNARTLTKGQLERFSRECMLEQDIDPVYVAYILGDSPGECSGLHYTQLQSSSIQDHYDEYLRCLGFESTDNSVRTSHVVGSALVPKDDFIEERFAGLAKEISALSSLKFSTQDLRFHNYYTLYVYLVLNMYVGHRGVGSPFELFSDFNNDFSLVLISDEDIGPGFQPRLGGIGNIGKKLLLNYKAYLQEWRISAKIFAPEIANYIRRVLANKAPVFFLFDKTGQITLMDPSDLKLYRENINPLAVNWQRHWLRTVLTGAYSGTQINGLMGHTAFNQNPGNIQSATDFSYLPDLANYLDKALQKLGVAVI